MGTIRGKVGMWLFLVSDALTFGGLLCAYGALRIGSPDWPVPSEVLNVPLTAFNTFVLVVSSLTMVKALSAIKRGDVKGLQKFLLLTALGRHAVLVDSGVRIPSPFVRGWTSPPEQSFLRHVFCADQFPRGTRLVRRHLSARHSMAIDQGGFQRRSEPSRGNCRSLLALCGLGLDSCFYVRLSRLTGESMEQTHAEPNYMKIFWWLSALTMIEVGVVYAHLPKMAMIIALILMALLKAFLVAWNFMHLRFEKAALIVIVAFPMLLLVDLFLGLMPDIAHRIF